MDEQLTFVRQIADRLGGSGIEYMLTGSLAMAIYTTPRMTRDIDVVVDCQTRDIDKLVDLFAPDCYIDRTAVQEAIQTQTVFNIIHNESIIKADFIVRRDEPYRKTEFARRRVIDLAGKTVSVVAPEDLRP